MTKLDIEGEVLSGLRETPRRLPTKYFYDARGSSLFERITELDAYYPTRTEVSLMEEHGASMASRLGSGTRLIEYGSGSGLKTRILLSLLEAPAGYVAIEISKTALEASISALCEDFPKLDVRGIHADYTAEIALDLPDAGRRVVYFPGSTIGNFTPSQAQAFLARIRAQVGVGGGLLIGVDLKKEPAVLHRAYNDEEGVTASFNRNILRRLNQTLDANFDVDRFHHYAFYNPAAGRIEMHLVSEGEQRVKIGDQTFTIRHGDPILTEYSYKYRPDEFDALAAAAGLKRSELWTDQERWFGVFFYEVA